MINRKNLSGESAFFAVTAIAICAVLVAAAAALVAPAAATSGASTLSSAATYSGPAGYFPEQFVNQAKGVEPMPEMYY
jgi:ABC-type molybdate transport system substrate-binding protein